MTQEPDVAAATSLSRNERLRVLLVGINYAPEHTGIAPYTTALAEHLTRIGHGVTVLTGMPHYPAWRVGPGYERRLARRERRNGVQLVRRAIYVPARQSAFRRALYEASFLATGLPVLGIDRPDAILGIVPSLSGAMLAGILAARYRTRYGVLFQDLMSQGAEQSGIKWGGRVASATRTAERWVVARATAVGGVSQLFLPALAGLGVAEERLWLVPNWAHVSPPTDSAARRADTRARLGWKTDEVIVLHAGNMGLKQGLDQVLAAAQRAARLGGRIGAIRFVLLGDGSQRGALEAKAKAAGICNVTFLKPEPAKTFMEVLSAADILLITERASVSDMALPSKLTSYAVAGRPVVAAVNPAGAAAEEIRAAGYGTVVPAGQADLLLATIDRLIVDTTQIQAMGAAGQAHARGALSPHFALARCSQFVAAIADGKVRPADMRGLGPRSPEGPEAANWAAEPALGPRTTRSSGGLAAGSTVR